MMAIISKMDRVSIYIMTPSIIVFIGGWVYIFSLIADECIQAALGVVK